LSARALLESSAMMSATPSTPASTIGACAYSSAIRWVSELIDIAGGDDIFPERAAASLGRDRIVADASEVVARAPDIIIGSWCGKKFRPEKVASRPGFDCLPAVQRGAVHEIKSPLILQPGPAALTDGLAALRAIIGNWQAVAPTPSRARVAGFYQ
jgi:iron complex transport system substrate-binding protein